MHNFFNFSRFSNLLKKHGVENFKYYLMSTAVLCGILILFNAFFSFESHGPANKSAQFAMFVMLFIFSGTIFTSTSFNNLTEKNKTVFTLTLPASQFEKYLIAWLFSVLIFPAVFLAAFYLIDFIFLYSVSKALDVDYEIVNVFSGEDSRNLVFLFYLILNSIALLGAIYFEKLHFIKTAFVFFILVFSFVWLDTYFLKAIIPEDIVSAMPFGNLYFNEDDNSFRSIAIDSNVQRIYVLATGVVFATLLWLAAYFKITEKQV